MSESLRDQLIRHEGLRLYPYKDSVGKLTVGVGRNIEDVGITEEEAMFLLATDINRCIEDAIYHLPWITTLCDVRREVIYNMTFNLGITRLLKFKKMLKALKEHDFNTAADEMLDSKWARQVKSRATELANQMRTGVRYA